MTTDQQPASDWAHLTLDTHGVVDKADLMNRLTDAFDLPAWFGRNWDALADCLTDVRPEPGLVVTWSGAAALADDLRGPLQEILEERADAGPTPFVLRTLE